MKVSRYNVMMPGGGGEYCVLIMIHEFDDTKI